MRSRWWMWLAAVLVVGEAAVLVVGQAEAAPPGLSRPGGRPGGGGGPSLPSLGGGGGLSRPTPGFAPSRPAPSLPSRPTPSRPTPSLPSRPSLPTPSLPSRPSLPTPTLPSRPTLPTPGLPTRPGLPTPSLPTRPGLPTPGLPTPGLPTPGVPSRPSFPGLPTTPSLPTTPNLPARPGLPTLPTPTLPTRPVLPTPGLPTRPEYPAIRPPVTPPSLVRPTPPIYRPGVPSPGLPPTLRPPSTLPPAIRPPIATLPEYLPPAIRPPVVRPPVVRPPVVRPPVVVPRPPLPPTIRPPVVGVPIRPPITVLPGQRPWNDPFFGSVRTSWHFGHWTSFYRPWIWTVGTSGTWVTVGGGIVFANPFWVAPTAQVPVYLDFSRPIVPVTSELPGPVAGARVEEALREFESAREAFRLADYRTAQTRIEAALRITPDDPALHEFRALVLFARENYRDAAAALYVVLASSPGWNWETMASFYRDVEDYSAQLAALATYVAANPDQAHGHFVLAYHLTTLGYADAALAEFREVLRLVPDDRLTAQLIRALEEDLARAAEGAGDEF